jgi:hypothetical protein
MVAQESSGGGGDWRVRWEQYVQLCLSDDSTAHYLFNLPFKDTASCLFRDDIRISNDIFGGVEQEKRWREFSVQVKEMYCKIGGIEHSHFVLRLMAIHCKNPGILLALCLITHPSTMIMLVMYSFPVFLDLVKDQQVHKRIQAIHALCKKETKESLCSLGSNGLTVSCETHSGNIFGAYTDPNIYLLRMDKQIQRFDVSNSRSARWCSCQHTPFEMLAAGYDVPCADMQVEWAEFWSKMTILCTHRTLYHYLPLTVRQSGVAIVLVIITVMQENLYFFFPVLVLSAVCYIYDMHLYCRQRMAKWQLVREYQRKFTPYNVHMEWREINHFHSWLGISVRQYVHVFLPFKLRQAQVIPIR